MVSALMQNRKRKGVQCTKENKCFTTDYLHFVQKYANGENQNENSGWKIVFFYIFEKKI